MSSDKKGKAPAFQMYASDFLTDTHEFTVCEVGAYIRLLLSQWVNGSLPPDPKRLAFIAGMDTVNFLESWHILKTKFKENAEGRLVNSRMEQVRERQQMYSENRRKCGVRGAEARWNGDGEILGNEPRNINQEVPADKKRASIKQVRQSEIVYPFAETEFVLAWEKWLLYKKQEHNKKYKTVVSENLAMQKLFKLANGNLAYALECIDLSISKQWQGIWSDNELKAKYEQGNSNNSKGKQSAYNPGGLSALNRALKKDAGS